MRRNTLIWLIVAAGLAAGIAWLVAGQRAPQRGDSAGMLLLPGLNSGLNDVTRIGIVTADGTPAVTLTRGAQAWQVEQRDNYPADTGKVRKYLLDLADAELVEAKTARPENYPALGVVTPGEEGASGVRVSLDGVAGAQPFVVGNAARGGSYVRRIDEGQSWLSDTDVSVDTDPTDWLDRDIMDIAAADVVSVEIRHPDGEIVSAQRNGVNLQLAQLPEGKVPTGPAAVNPLAGVLSLLRCDDVQSAASFDAADLEPVEAVWTSADGIVVEARLYSRDDARYAAFDVRFEPPPPAADAADADAAESEPGASPAEAAVADKDAATAVESDGARDEAQRIAARTAGWVYRLPTAKYRQMTRRANDFLRDADSGD